MTFIDYRRGLIVVSFPYSKDAVEGVKYLAREHGARKAWDAENKVWKLPATAATSIDAMFPGAVHSDTFTELLQEQKYSSEKAAIAQGQLKAEWERLRDLPQRDGKTLFAHQKDAVGVMLTQGTILAHDMGLGKTRTALTAAAVFRTVFDCQIVVICPAGLKTAWREEAERLGVERVSVYSWAKVPEPPEGKFILIADEAHYAQSWKAARTVAFIALSQAAALVWCVTGTPMRSGRPVNLFPLLRSIGHPVARNKSEYEMRYCDAKATRFSQWDVSGAANLEELKHWTKDSILRRRKEDCLDLPAKTRIMKEVEVTASMEEDYRRAYWKARDHFEAKVERGEANSDAEAFVALNIMRHASSIAKVEYAVELGSDILEEGRQCVIFTAYRESAKRIAKILTPGVVPYTGEATPKYRDELVKLFKAGNVPAFVATIQAGGVGLDLWNANHVILVDRPWTPGDALQAEDRVHRIGQVWPVTATWIQAFDVDRWVDELLLSKMTNISRVIDGESELAVLTQRIDAKRLLGRLFGREVKRPCSVAS